MENNIYATKKLLLNVGISPNLDGYHYLTEAINTVKGMLKSGDVDCKFTVLYKDIGKKFNTTSARTERSMRHAIEKAFSSNNSLLKTIFNSLVDTRSGKVTVSCFVFTIAEYLIMEEGI